MNNQACVVTETLWCNFESGRMHWNTVAGSDTADRQQIRRKAANRGRIQRDLQLVERQSVLQAILAVMVQERYR